MFVHFSDPDEAGHARGWMSRAYLAAVKESDRCLGELLHAIDASGEPTLVIITADHGGHGHRHSGGRSDVDRDIPWIALGPGIAPGSVLADPVATVDTAATALAALQLPAPPNMQGTVRLRLAR